MKLDQTYESQKDKEKKRLMRKGFAFSTDDPNRCFQSRLCMGPVGIHQTNLICEMEGQEMPTTSCVTVPTGRHQHVRKVVNKHITKPAFKGLMWTKSHPFNSDLFCVTWYNGSLLCDLWILENCISIFCSAYNYTSLLISILITHKFFFQIHVPQVYIFSCISVLTFSASTFFF